MKFDLIIIDIDDTFLPHRTVNVGYKLFWKYKLSRKGIKLGILGLRLYLMKCIREIKNRFSKKNVTSNSKLIEAWAKGIINTGIDAKEYAMQEHEIKKKIYPKILEDFNKLKKQNPTTHVIAITQSFNLINKNEKLNTKKTLDDPIVSLLGVDELFSNIFYYEKTRKNSDNSNNDNIKSKKNKNKSNDNVTNKIIDKELLIKDGFDKRDIAQKAIDKYKAENIGLLIDDYDDLELLRLKGNVKVIYAGKKIRKIVNKYINI